MIDKRFENFPEQIKVNVMLAESFDPDKNSLNGILSKVINRKTIDFCIYLTVRMTEKMNITVGEEPIKFTVGFYLGKFPDTPDDSMQGFVFARYNAIMGRDSPSEFELQDRRKRYTEGCYDKIITIRDFQDIPLNGVGMYVLYAYLDESGEEMIGDINKETILDGWQFRVV